MKKVIVFLTIIIIFVVSGCECVDPSDPEAQYKYARIKVVHSDGHEEISKVYNLDGVTDQQ